MDFSDSPDLPGAAPDFADLPDASLDVALNLADDFEAIKLTEDNPRVQADELAIDPDKFVQKLLQREFERRRELAEQQRRSQAPSRTSAPSRLGQAHLQASDPGPDSSFQRQHGESEDVPDAIAVYTDGQAKGRSSFLQTYTADALEVQDGDQHEPGPGGIEAAAKRVSALRRRSSFLPAEEPDPVGFQREKDARDHVNQVDAMLQRLTKRKKSNSMHMYKAMVEAGVIGPKQDIQLPRRTRTAANHGAHQSRSRPEKKKNVEVANKWIEDTKPRGWLVFSEKANWIQTREIQKDWKNGRVKMLRDLNKRGTSFATWLSDHGREYGICEDGIIHSLVPEKEELQRKSVAQEEEAKKEQEKTRVSMALNDGVGIMYKGVSALGSGPDKAANTGKFWRPTQNRTSGLQAPTGFHTI